MPKPNAKCPCKSGKKYKKCCSQKDKKKKFEHPETCWPNYGERHPLYRFFIGQAVEARYGEGFLPGKVKQFNYIQQGMDTPAAYQILLDEKPEGGGRLIWAAHDRNDLIRPYG